MTIANLATIPRSERYEVRIAVDELDGLRVVRISGWMKSPQGRFIPARAMNFKPAELGDVIAALERARGILS